MATNEERQTLGHLRQIAAYLQSRQGTRDFATILDRGSGSRDTGVLQNSVKYDRLVVSVYSLKPPKATEPAPDDKPATRTAKAKLTVKVNSFLNESETYLIVADTLEKEGQHTIELPFLTTKHQIVVECDETAEYAVFGL